MPAKITKECAYQGTSQCVNCGECGEQVLCDECGCDLLSQGESCLYIESMDLCLCEECLNAHTLGAYMMYD